MSEARRPGGTGTIVEMLDVAALRGDLGLPEYRQRHQPIASARLVAR